MVLITVDAGFYQPTYNVWEPHIVSTLYIFHHLIQHAWNSYVYIDKDDDEHWGIPKCGALMRYKLVINPCNYGYNYHEP